MRIIATIFVVFAALLALFTLYMAWEHSLSEAKAERDKTAAKLGAVPTPAV